jgi:Kef-type K+ transport system membrane component KefB
MDVFPQWIIILIVVIVLSRVAVLLGRRFGIPSITIQLLTGILLGPSLFNFLGVPIVLGTWGSPSPSPIHTILKILTEIGLIQLMFLAGLEVDWRELEKMLKPSFSVGAWGFVLTAVSVAIITRVFVDCWSEALAVSAVLSASSFGISGYYFSETKVLGSQVALTVLGAAILSGLLAILLMIASQATNYAVTYGAFKMTVAVSWFLAKLIMFFAISYFLASRFLKLVEKTGFGKRPRQMLIGYLLLVAALYAWAAMHFGSFASVGVASLGGALLGASGFGFREKISKGFGSMLGSLPIGVLFVVIGMETNFRAASDTIIFLIVVFTVMVAAKLIGSWIATRKDFDSLYGRILIGFGILPQGEMGMLVAAYLFSRGLVSPPSFNSVIILVVVLTMIVPVVMKVLGRLPFQEGAVMQERYRITRMLILVLAGFLFGPPFTERVSIGI